MMNDALGGAYYYSSLVLYDLSHVTSLRCIVGARAQLVDVTNALLHVYHNGVLK